jgi:quinol monooxygenase YgiN
MQVDRDDLRSRPMIAVLDARQVRSEPGCLTFTRLLGPRHTRPLLPLRGLRQRRRIRRALRTKHIRDFIAAVPALSTASPEA